MDYNELLLTFSKLEWKVFRGFYNSFVCWGIAISPTIDCNDYYFEVEKHFKNNIVLYDLEFIFNNNIVYKKENLEILDYIKILNDILQKMVDEKHIFIPKPKINI